MKVYALSGNRSEPGPIRAEGNIPLLIQKLKFGLRIQSLVSLSLAAVLLLVAPVAATSSFLGSLVVYLPGWVFTVLVLRRLGGDSGAFLRTATLAEFGKLLLTGTLCAAVFIWVKPLWPGYFFLGMIVTLATGWAALAMAFQQADKMPLDP